MKTFFVDTTRCTACRGCQLACKEWNELPAVSTKQRGSHQNPPDLTAHNYKVVRFSEHLVDNKPAWYFFPDQCRHCLQPPCKDLADTIMEGAILQDEATGAVLYTEKTKEISESDFEAVKGACPYDIPRREESTGRITKCTMCFERITNNMLPACVKTCPTGTMNFGEREAMLELAEKRLADVRKEFPAASLADTADVNVIYLLADAPGKYHSFAVAEAGPALGDSRRTLADASLRRTLGSLLRG